MEIYFTFPSTSAVITAEQVLIAAGMKVKVRPVPGEIRAGCGLCLAVSPDKQKEAMDILKEKSAEYSEIYFVQDGTYTRIQ